MRDMTDRLVVVLIPNPGSRLITVVCPQVPGAISQGATEQEALNNIREAISSVVKVRVANGKAPYESDESLIAAAEEDGYASIREVIADTLIDILKLDPRTAREAYPILQETARNYKNMHFGNAFQVQRRMVEVPV